MPKLPTSGNPIPTKQKSYFDKAPNAMSRATRNPPSQVANAVDGTAVQSRIDELQRQLAGQQAQIQDLQERLEHAIEITRDKQDEFASVAQAEGVSLSVARRLLQVVAESVTTPSVPTLGRATEEAGQRAGQLLEVLDEVAQPKVKQATADEIFLGPNRS